MWTPIVRQPEAFSKCSPADFSTGCDRACRNAHDIASAFPLVNINPVVGGCAGGDVGEGAAGRRSRSSTYPRAFCFVGLTRRAIAQALVLTLLIIKAEPDKSRARSRCRPWPRRHWHRR